MAEQEGKRKTERVNESDECTVIKMRLNKIFNTVNNKERGQSFGSLQSAVLHHLHVLSTAFS